MPRPQPPPQPPVVAEPGRRTGARCTAARRAARSPPPRHQAVVLRRGLPRVSGRDPWPEAGQRRRPPSRGDGCRSCGDQPRHPQSATTPAARRRTRRCRRSSGHGDHCRASAGCGRDLRCFRFAAVCLARRTASRGRRRASPRERGRTGRRHPTAGGARRPARGRARSIRAARHPRSSSAPAAAASVAAVPAAPRPSAPPLARTAIRPHRYRRRRPRPQLPAPVVAETRTLRRLHPRRS